MSPRCQLEITLRGVSRGVVGATLRLMSDGELTRLEVQRDLDQRRLTTEAAGQLLGLERRQVFRLLKTYRSEGATGLISKRRGRPNNRCKPEELRDKAFRAGLHNREAKDLQTRAVCHAAGGDWPHCRKPARSAGCTFADQDNRAICMRHAGASAYPFAVFTRRIALLRLRGARATV
jgi:Winged helix-turn helix